MFMFQTNTKLNCRLYANVLCGAIAFTVMILLRKGYGSVQDEIMIQEFGFQFELLVIIIFKNNLKTP